MKNKIKFLYREKLHNKRYKDTNNKYKKLDFYFIISKFGVIYKKYTHGNFYLPLGGIKNLKGVCVPKDCKIRFTKFIEDYKNYMKGKHEYNRTLQKN